MVKDGLWQGDFERGFFGVLVENFDTEVAEGEFGGAGAFGSGGVEAEADFTFGVVVGDADFFDALADVDGDVDVDGRGFLGGRGQRGGEEAEEKKGPTTHGGWREVGGGRRAIWPAGFG